MLLLVLNLVTLLFYSSIIYHLRFVVKLLCGCNITFPKIIIDWCIGYCFDICRLNNQEQFLLNICGSFPIIRTKYFINLLNIFLKWLSHIHSNSKLDQICVYFEVMDVYFFFFFGNLEISLKEAKGYYGCLLYFIISST